MEFRSAILIGLFGSFTTFSTFSLETLYLIEQGSLSKASLNIVISVFACLFAVWFGLLTGRTLFMYSGGIVRWVGGGVFPYALVTVNAIGAFLIGLVAATLMQKTSLAMEYQAAVLIILLGIFISLSGLYLILYLFENGFSIKAHLNLMLGVFVINTLVCLLSLWIGLFSGKQL
jgi:CrcB protein